MQRQEHSVDTTALAEHFGYYLHTDFSIRDGWLLNYQIKEKVPNGESRICTYVVLYFVDEEGKSFRVETIFYPRFIICVEEKYASGIEEYILQRYGTSIKQIEEVQKKDLAAPNHLSEREEKKENVFLSVQCYTEKECILIRKEIDEIVRENKQRKEEQSVILLFAKEKRQRKEWAAKDSILGTHESDIAVEIQMAITMNINVGKWYTVEYTGEYKIEECKKVIPPELRILSYDIETTKDPLKFPNAEKDKVMMVSVMANEKGWLIVNRECVLADINPFEYQPTHDIGGKFSIFNEPTEKEVLKRFLELVHSFQPHVISSYNGDFFDWPFIDTRLSKNGISLTDTTGFYKSARDEYLCDFILHMDCFKWVKRDSYLPVGSQGLKSVTRAKLGYHPDEIDPENMVLFARTKPKMLAVYSVSDAVATHFLYLKYVHPFIFSLASLIPMPSDNVLRKGSGSLCEALLMKEANKCNVLIPAKKRHETLYEYNGRKAESISYVGGHVEALKCGVFRSDFRYEFTFNAEYIRGLIQRTDEIIEMELNGRECANKEEVKKEINKILEQLLMLKTAQLQPHIYHLDVGAMYPNIILTNRLQPVAVVTEKTCAQCIYNREKNLCQRKMQWKMRAEVYPVDSKTVKRISKKIIDKRKEESKEKKEGEEQGKPSISYEQELKNALIECSKKFYKKTKEVVLEDKESIICQRENPFYVNAVRDFKDKRNEYKRMAKEAHGKARAAQQEGKPQEEQRNLQKTASIYDSLQIAHKCILNSFYGYVMKKGARWHSMEMAAVVCQTGSYIIQQTKAVVDAFGITLELDTDGIWILLPENFPLNYTLTTSEGPVSFSYICSVLNHMIIQKFTNTQYQERAAEGEYVMEKKNYIRFEIDGPYRSMFLPGSAKEGESIKKRYIIINEKKKISEIKGFEFKRRGELRFIKAFQEEFFNTLLAGSNLNECYAELASCGNYWIEIIESKGHALNNSEIFEYFSETRSISKDSHEYGSVKSTCLTAMERLSELLGQNMSGKGVSCTFIISRFPEKEPVTSRSVPQAVFYVEEEIRTKYLRKWLRMHTIPNDIRDIIDWGYYMERLSNVITKILIVPAAMQNVPNPLPKIPLPPWAVQNNKLLRFLDKKACIQIEKKNLKSNSNSQGSLLLDKNTGTLKGKLNSKVAFGEKSQLPAYFQVKANAGEISINEEQLEQIQDTLPPAGIIKIEEETYTRIYVEDNAIKTETVECKKQFYLQARSTVLDRLMHVYERSAAHNMNLSRGFYFVVGESEKKDLLKITVTAREFKERFSMYTELFESPEVDAIYEVEIPSVIRAYQEVKYVSIPTIVVAFSGTEKKFMCVTQFKDKKNIFRDASELQKYMLELPAAIVFTTKNPPKKILENNRFFIIPVDKVTPRGIKGEEEAEYLLTETLTKIYTEVREIEKICKYAKIPLTIPLTSANTKSVKEITKNALDYLYYKERRERNIIGWGDSRRSSDIHYSLSGTDKSIFEKDFYEQGVYQGFSVNLHFFGTILLGIIESEYLLQEENAKYKQSVEMKALHAFAKDIVLGCIKQEEGALTLASHIPLWISQYKDNCTITGSIANEISVLRTKFISGIIRTIKLSGCNIIHVDYEDVLVHTKQSTLAAAEAHIQSILQEIRELEYGMLLNVQIGSWYKTVVMIDPTNYYFLSDKDIVYHSFRCLFPLSILQDLLQGNILSSLEYLRDLINNERETAIVLARILIIIHKYNQGNTAYNRQVANILSLSEFSDALTKEIESPVSIFVICNCGYNSIFYSPMPEQVPKEKEIEKYFDTLICHPKKSSYKCKRCKNLFLQDELDRAVRDSIYEEAKAAVKQERQCMYCKKPAQGIIARHCSCGGLFKKNYSETLSKAVKRIFSLSNFSSTAASLIYARDFLLYLKTARFP